MDNRYWFKGMKLSIGVIAECLNISTSYIQMNRKKFNLTTQEYIRGIQNCKPRDEIRNYRDPDAKFLGGKKPARLVEGLTLSDISKKYDIPKSTLNARYVAGNRTIEDIIKPREKIM